MNLRMLFLINDAASVPPWPSNTCPNIGIQISHEHSQLKVVNKRPPNSLYIYYLPPFSHFISIVHYPPIISFNFTVRKHFETERQKLSWLQLSGIRETWRKIGCFQKLKELPHNCTNVATSQSNLTIVWMEWPSSGSDHMFLSIDQQLCQ